MLKPSVTDPMPNEAERFDDWWASACALPPYTLEHLRWAFNAGGMSQRMLDEAKQSLCDSCEKPQAPDNGYFCAGHGEQPKDATTDAAGFTLRDRIVAHFKEDHELDCPSGECHELLCEVLDNAEQAQGLITQEPVDGAH